MIQDAPRPSILNDAFGEFTPHKKALESIYMVLGILGSMRRAIDPDQDTDITTGELFGAIEAAIFLLEITQEQICMLQDK